MFAHFGDKIIELTVEEALKVKALKDELSTEVFITEKGEQFEPYDVHFISRFEHAPYQRNMWEKLEKEIFTMYASERELVFKDQKAKEKHEKYLDFLWKVKMELTDFKKEFIKNHDSEVHCKEL